MSRAAPLAALVAMLSCATLTALSCASPPEPLLFPPDLAIGPFAPDPGSPVVARGDAGSLDEIGATAPSVYADGQGLHAVYLGLDADGGTHLLGADQVDAGIWQKEAEPVVPTQGQVGRPAAVVFAGQRVVFYDQLQDAGSLIQTTLSGGATIAGASQPCALALDGGIQIFAVSAADSAIHLYRSPDGFRAFVDQGAVLTATNQDGGFDAFQVSAPSVIVELSALGRTLYRMWYVGAPAPGGTLSIGLAGSFDGVTWERYAENPVLFPGDVPSVYAAGDAGFDMLFSQTPFATPSDVSEAFGP